MFELNYVLLDEMNGGVSINTIKEEVEEESSLDDKWQEDLILQEPVNIKGEESEAILTTIIIENRINVDKFSK